MKKVLKAGKCLFFLLLTGVLWPSFSYAQVNSGGAQGIGTVFIELANKLFQIIEVLIPVAFGAGVVFFFWGLAVFILHADDTSARERAKAIMIWGTFAIFIMASIWGITKILQDTFSISSNTQISIPKINKN